MQWFIQATCIHSNNMHTLVSLDAKFEMYVHIASCSFIDQGIVEIDINFKTYTCTHRHAHKTVYLKYGTHAMEHVIKRSVISFPVLLNDRYKTCSLICVKNEFCQFELHVKKYFFKFLSSFEKVDN